MATIRQDDLDKKIVKDVANHILALDGIEYEVDLGPGNYARLLRLLEPFMIRKTDTQTMMTSIRPAPSASPAAVRAQFTLANPPNSSTG